MSMMRELLMAKQQKKKIVKWLDANRTDSAEMAASDAAAIAVFKKNGWCKHDDYMTVEEAARVTNLPMFYQSSAQDNIISWDWSALINLNNISLANYFKQCTSLYFENLDNEIFSRNIKMNNLFYLARSPVFVGNKLPEGFAKRTTAIDFMFAGTSIKLDYLNDDFGENHPTANSLFSDCGAVGLKALPTNFEPSTISGIFKGCTLQLTSFPKNFGTRGSVNGCCWDTKFGGDTLYVGENFGKESAHWVGSFRNTNIKYFIGTFDFSSVTSTSANNGLWDVFYQSSVISIRFVKNCLKSSITMLTIKLLNIDKLSLLSFAECLYDWRDETGILVGNDNKTWGVSTAQKTILDTEMYDDTRTYTQYVEDKGWTVTI